MPSDHAMHASCWFVQVKYDALKAEQAALLEQHMEVHSMRSSLRQQQVSAEDRAAAAQAKVRSY